MRIEDLFKGVGTLFRATPGGHRLHTQALQDAELQQRNDEFQANLKEKKKDRRQQKFSNAMGVLQSIQDPKERVRMANEILRNYPDQLKMAIQLKKRAMTSPQESRTQEAWDAMTSDQKVRGELPYGGRRRTAQPAETSRYKEAVTRLKDLNALQDELGEDVDPKTQQNINEERQAVMSLLNPPEATIPEGVWSPGMDWASVENAGFFSDKSAAVDPETGLTSIPGKIKGKIKGKAQDVRDLFTGGVNPFQAPTPASPGENTPQTFDQMGMDTQSQQDFVELEKQVGGKLPEGTDLRQDVVNYPESYKKLFQAMKTGVPDGKGGTRKLTTAEIIKIIESMGK